MSDSDFRNKLSASIGEYNDLSVDCFLLKKANSFSLGDYVCLKTNFYHW